MRLVATISQVYTFNPLRVYHHAAIEVVNKHDAFSDNAEKDDEREGAAMDIDRFNYMFKETNLLKNLSFYSSFDQV